MTTTLQQSIDSMNAAAEDAAMDLQDDPNRLVGLNASRIVLRAQDNSECLYRLSHKANELRYWITLNREAAGIPSTQAPHPSSILNLDAAMVVLNAGGNSDLLDRLDLFAEQLKQCADKALYGGLLSQPLMVAAPEQTISTFSTSSLKHDPTQLRRIMGNNGDVQLGAAALQQASKDNDNPTRPKNYSLNQQPTSASEPQTRLVMMPVSATAYQSYVNKVQAYEEQQQLQGLQAASGPTNVGGAASFLAATAKPRTTSATSGPTMTDTSNQGSVTSSLAKNHPSSVVTTDSSSALSASTKPSSTTEERSDEHGESQMEHPEEMVEEEGEATTATSAGSTPTTLVSSDAAAATAQNSERFPVNRTNSMALTSQNGILPNQSGFPLHLLQQQQQGWMLEQQQALLVAAASRQQLWGGGGAAAAAAAYGAVAPVSSSSVVAAAAPAPMTGSSSVMGSLVAAASMALNSPSLQQQSSSEELGGDNSSRSRQALRETQSESAGRFAENVSKMPVPNQQQAPPPEQQENEKSALDKENSFAAEMLLMMSSGRNSSSASVVSSSETTTAKKEQSQPAECEADAANAECAKEEAKPLEDPEAPDQQTAEESTTSAKPVRKRKRKKQDGNNKSEKASKSSKSDEVGGAKPPAAAKKKKKVKQQNPPGMPKMWINAYSLFYQREHKRLREEKEAVGERLDPKEGTKAIGQLWRALTSEDKKPFQEQAAVNKERYTKEKEEFLKKYNEEQAAAKAAATDSSDAQVVEGEGGLTGQQGQPHNADAMKDTMLLHHAGGAAS